jgi:hypothetical protein
MEQLFTTPNLDIFLQDEIMICQWKGQQTTEGIMNAGNIILSLVAERRIPKVLIDNSQLIGSWHEVTDWTARIWFPAMANAGIKSFAWILADDIFAASSARRAMPSGLHIIRIFGNYNEAHRWLLSH